jgi:Ca2+-binding EF-hand superfamily protein
MLRILAFVTALAVPAVAAAQQPCTTDARRVVSELYRTVLERSADRGSDAAVRRLATGQTSVRDLVREIATSREHSQRFTRATNSDAERRNAVIALYRHVLGRQPDPGGLDAHMRGIQEQGVVAVVDAMQNSEEYRQNIGDNGVPGTQIKYCGGSLDTSNRVGDRFRGMDTNGDNRITRNEWQGTAWTFSSTDQNGDGVITADELGGYGNNRVVGTSGTVDTDAAAWFDGLDRNRNGRLERNEWTGSAAEFERLDSNRNNLLSRDEAMAGFGATANAANVEEFNRLDVDRDGGLTIREWNWNRRSFDQQDTNGDGVITPREFRGRPATNGNNGNNRNGF